MVWSPKSRRALLGLTGVVVAGGCLSSPNGNTSAALPVLVGITVANDTDQDHEYHVRVQFTSDADSTPETVSEFEGTIRARDQKELNSEWTEEAGRYRVEVSVDGGDWHVQDVTDRFTQEEQICYHEEVAITGNDVRFLVDLDAPCPA